MAFFIHQDGVVQGEAETFVMPTGEIAIAPGSMSGVGMLTLEIRLNAKEAIELSERLLDHANRVLVVANALTKRGA
jgi:hypothetical protein